MEQTHLIPTEGEKKYTTAFMCITLSGEIYVARQFKADTLIECAKWRRENREEIEKLYGETVSITLSKKQSYGF